MSGRRLGAS